MRFVSKAGNESLGSFRKAKEGIAAPETHYIDGKAVSTAPAAYVLQPAIPIQFSQAGLTQADIDAAIAQWKHFPGLPVEEDQVTPVNPVDAGRIGVWDSREFQATYELSDDERVEAENLLLNSRNYGIAFIKVEEIRAPLPWKTYDSMHHNKIAAFAQEAGLVAEALAYEQENKQRATVLEQLEAALPAESGEFVAA